IPAEHLHVEDQSTNCGENARFSRAWLEQAGPHGGPVGGVQEPKYDLLLYHNLQPNYNASILGLRVCA
ncbi:hypothetical protein ACVGXJ_00100, partial [Enterobacter hormaechei]